MIGFHFNHVIYGQCMIKNKGSVKGPRITKDFLSSGLRHSCAVAVCQALVVLEFLHQVLVSGVPCWLWATTWETGGMVSCHVMRSELWGTSWLHWIWWDSSHTEEFCRCYSWTFLNSLREVLGIWHGSHWLETSQHCPSLQEGHKRRP